MGLSSAFPVFPEGFPGECRSAAGLNKGFSLEGFFLPVQEERGKGGPFSGGLRVAALKSGLGHKIRRKPQGWIQRKAPPFPQPPASFTRLFA